MTTPTVHRLGIVAGDKHLPFILVDYAKSRGIQVFVAGIKGCVSPDLKTKVPHDNYIEYPISSLSATIRFFHSKNVDTVILAGGVSGTKVGFSFDLIRAFFYLLGKKNKYDEILRYVIKRFEGAGFSVIGIHDFMPHLLIERGLLTKIKPTASNLSDAKFGYPMAVQFAQTDKGQSIIVKDKTVIATERFSGTDALIRYASTLPNSNGAILVKVIKPQQEIRADIPVLGVNTIRKLSNAGFSGVVIQSDKSIIDNKSEVISLADSLGIFILGTDGNF